MNISFSTFDITSNVFQVPVSSIPRTIWELYLEYLWFYQSDSWVATIAYSCRVLAVLICLPIIILGLLDIASYGIARTLGVVDDVKASTSDKTTVHIQSSAVLNHGVTSPTSEESSLSDSDRESPMDHTQHNRLKSPLSNSLMEVPNTITQPPTVFYAEDSGKLSGVGLFSPTTSSPPSPTIGRHNLSEITSDNLRHRTKQSNTSNGHRSGND